MIEYFTKRGRPLSADELKKLQEEDQAQREEQEWEQRQFDEQLMRKSKGRDNTDDEAAQGHTLADSNSPPEG